METHIATIYVQTLLQDANSFGKYIMIIQKILPENTILKWTGISILH